MFFLGFFFVVLLLVVLVVASAAVGKGSHSGYDGEDCCHQEGSFHKDLSILPAPVAVNKLFLLEMSLAGRTSRTSLMLAAEQILALNSRTGAGGGRREKWQNNGKPDIG